MATKSSSELYTAAKLAEALGVSEGKVKKIIQTLNIQPDEVKRGCKYYGQVTLENIKKALP